VNETPTASTEFVAALGMYDFAWTAPANDKLWGVIAARLGAAGLMAPAALTRDVDLHDLWVSPRLVFGQTCGYPYITALHPRVALVATPIYDFPGCVGAANCSFLVTGKKGERQNLAEFRGARALINNRDSNSGMNRFRAMIAPLAGGKPFFSEVGVSGSHAASLDAIAADRADLASIDCVSFALIRRGRPEVMDNIRIVATTAMTQGLPLITSNALAPTHLQQLRLALVDALVDPSLAPARKALGLAGMRMLAPADYDDVAELEREAIAAGYPVLA
jgi:ABC-type phosphate/phosphonate transport system substrate-binding protein